MAGQQLVVDNVVVGGTTIKEMDFQPRLRPSDYSIMCSSNSILSLKPMKASIDYCPVWRCQCVCVCVCVCVHVHLHAALHQNQSHHYAPRR